MKACGHGPAGTPAHAAAPVGVRARRRAGIIREAVWIQPGPGGNVAVLYLEADDLATAFTILATSAEPFDRWFRGHVRQVHGIALDEGFTAPELVLDFDTSRI